MFTGEYNHTIDIKGRMIVPVRYRSQLGDEFVVTRSLDGCLSLYAAEAWRILEEKLNALPMTNEKARRLKRFLLGGAVYCELDKQGRILLPATLREKVGIDKDVKLVGVGDHVEIWDTATWTEENEAVDVHELAEDMEGLGI